MVSFRTRLLSRWPCGTAHRPRRRIMRDLLLLPLALGARAAKGTEVCGAPMGGSDWNPSTVRVLAALHRGHRVACRSKAAQGFHSPATCLTVALNRLGRLWRSRRSPTPSASPARLGCPRRAMSAASPKANYRRGVDTRAIAAFYATVQHGMSIRPATAHRARPPLPLPTAPWPRGTGWPRNGETGASPGWSAAPRRSSSAHRPRHGRHAYALAATELR
jgi:hypothetical protein